jgi:DNA-3-methyladenine glycosylase II
MRTLNKEKVEFGLACLQQVDKRLIGLRSEVSEIPFWGRRPGYAALFKIILEQQVSLRAAHTMYRRLWQALGGITPERVLHLGATRLQQMGMTRQKAGYVFDLASAISDGKLNLTAVAAAGDETGMEMLMRQRGIGPWSVDIYYLMCLRRPDIWPRNDLALATAMHRALQLKTRPTSAEQQNIAAQWALWRSVAARLFWAWYLKMQPGRV